MSSRFGLTGSYPVKYLNKDKYCRQFRHRLISETSHQTRHLQGQQKRIFHRITAKGPFQVIRRFLIPDLKPRTRDVLSRGLSSIRNLTYENRDQPKQPPSQSTAEDDIIHIATLLLVLVISTIAECFLTSLCSDAKSLDRNVNTIVELAGGDALTLRNLQVYERHRSSEANSLQACACAWCSWIRIPAADDVPSYQDRFLYQLNIRDTSWESGRLRLEYGFGFDSQLIRKFNVDGEEFEVLVRWDSRIEGLTIFQTMLISAERTSISERWIEFVFPKQLPEANEQGSKSVLNFICDAIRPG